MFGYFEQKANDLWQIVAPEASELDSFVTSIESNRIQQVQSLISSGKFTPNTLVNRGKEGNKTTVLHIACKAGHLDLVQYLINAGGNVYLRNEDRNSCLHFASMSRNLDLVKFFLQANEAEESSGAEGRLRVTEKNRFDQNVYDVAQSTDYPMKQYLMKLVFKEENESGSQVEMLGVSRDRKADEERLKHIGPPPTGGPSASGPSPGQTGMAPAPTFAFRKKPGAAYRPIKENDGFGTTVGNPALAAKYGNKSNYKPVEVLPESSIPTIEKIKSTESSTSVSTIGTNGTSTLNQPPSLNRNPNPLTRPRMKYVPYHLNTNSPVTKNANNMTTEKPSQPYGNHATTQAQYPGGGRSPAVASPKFGLRKGGVKIFNPALKK